MPTNNFIAWVRRVHSQFNGGRCDCKYCKPKVMTNVDTWPDWKLDSYSLRQRNKRREAGEQLPKPTHEQERIAELERQNAELLTALRLGHERQECPWCYDDGQCEVADAIDNANAEKKNA